MAAVKKPVSDLERRIAAVNATRSHFGGRPFEWGKTDCAKVASFHLRQMGHHKPLGIEKAGTYRTALKAKRALTKAGFVSLGDALDGAGLLRIPPAAALPGDLIITPGTDDWEALTIVAGNMAILGFHEDVEGLQVIRLTAPSLGQGWRA